MLRADAYSAGVDAGGADLVGADAAGVASADCTSDVVESEQALNMPTATRAPTAPRATRFLVIFTVFFFA